MYISDLFTVIGYLHTAGFRNRRGINFAKCRSLLEYIMDVYRKGVKKNAVKFQY